MHVLIIPSWYPNKNNDTQGIFFKEQVEGLATKSDIIIGCIALNQSSLRYLFSKQKSIYDYKNEIINNVQTINFLHPTFGRNKKIHSAIRKSLFIILFKIYLKKYGKPDLVHLHSFLYGELAIWIKEEYNIPYVVTEHNSGLARNIIKSKCFYRAKKIFETSDYNIAVSRLFGNLLKNKFNIEFAYLPNSVNINFFDIIHLGKKDTFDFINIASLDKNKNQEMLIKAFSHSFRNESKIKLTIVGRGGDYNILEGLIKDLNMGNNIILYGKASREEVKALLQNSDVFVLPSQFETFGVVIIEAMACGLPVVATKCGGPETIIVNNKLGILSDIDEISFSKALSNIYENKSKYDTNYIRRYVEDNFSSEVISNKLINIYESTLKRYRTV